MNKGTSKTSFLVRSNQPVWLSGSWVGSHPQSDVETFWLLQAFRISNFGSFRLIQFQFLNFRNLEFVRLFMKFCSVSIQLTCFCLFNWNSKIKSQIILEKKSVSFLILLGFQFFFQIFMLCWISVLIVRIFKRKFQEKQNFLINIEQFK